MSRSKDREGRHVARRRKDNACLTKWRTLTLVQIYFKTPKKGDVFDRSTKNRASERYPVPHKKAAKIDQIQVSTKLNFFLVSDVGPVHKLDHFIPGIFSS
jgi:hypothetical protein